MQTSIPTAPKRPRVTRANRPYTAHGAAAAAWACRAREVVLEGPAGTGKTRNILEKIHWCAQKYPGCRILLTRKTRESMTESVLVTFEEQVLPESSPLAQGPKRANRQSYDYPNGSSVVVAGLVANGKDQRAKVMSTEYDMIAVFEATELAEDELEKLASRLRNGVMPYQQLIADCNPDAPTHWLHLRCDAGVATVFFSRHEDNPRLYDHQRGDWTAFGRDYITGLETSLKGVQLDRLRYGRRAIATGVIYDMWEPGHATTDADYAPDGGPVYLWADDGYAGQIDPRTGLYTAESHPRVFLFAQERATGQLCVFGEHHAIRQPAPRHIRDALAYLGELTGGMTDLEYAAVDKSAAELKGVLTDEFGIYTRNSPATVEESIKVVMRFLSPDDNGWRRLLIHPRCRLTLSELPMYRRDDNGRIVKAFDHAMDDLRYGCWQFRTG